MTGRSIATVAALVTCASGVVRADAVGSERNGPMLVALAPADDARKAIAIGPAGQVYAPDGKGAWVRTSAISTAARIRHVARAGSALLAYGEGVVYRLASNGWSALRLHQKSKAVMSAGTRPVAAVGRQLLALDRMVGSEPVKLAIAPAAALEIGAGPTGVVIATERGLFRSIGGAFRPIPRAPRRVARLVSERWALLDRAAFDLRSGRATAWPAGLSVDVAAPFGDGLVAAAVSPAGVELLWLGGSAAKGARRRVGPRVAARPAGPAPAAGGARELLPGTAGAEPVGIVVDRARRVTIALADGRLGIRDSGGTWTLVPVAEALPAARTGPPPATSP